MSNFNLISQKGRLAHVNYKKQNVIHIIMGINCNEIANYCIKIDVIDDNYLCTLYMLTIVC